jgi:tRNA A-37 threonylcarbamoyl transferase component Bud32/tetratricopeptide (TPR) repeat protein
LPSSCKFYKRPGKSIVGAFAGLSLAEELLDCRQTDKLVGTLFSDRYQILSLLGEGGTGLVYKARHILMNRHVAIKIIRSELLNNQTLINRFQQEAMAVSKLNHQNIVKVHDFGVTPEGAPFLVMDFIDGTSLAEMLINEGSLPSERALPIFLQACDALQHAHQVGIVHRDLKSSNLMICSENGKLDIVKVVDFGMAKLLRPDEDTQFQELTQTGDVFGSPLYMSPEQCRGQILDERSDIYSLGCVMYYAISGRPPCQGENVLDTLQRQINEKPQSLLASKPDLPMALNQVILKALRKNPDDRYQTMRDMIMDVEAIADGRERILVSQQMSVVDAQQELPPDKPAAVVAPHKRVGHNFELMVICGVFAVFLIAGTGFISGRLFEVADATQEENMWAELNEAGDDARAGGQLAKAEEDYKNAIVEALKVGKRNPKLAKSLLCLGATYAQDGQFARSEVTLKRAVGVLEKCYGPDCPELSTVLVTLARTYEDQGRSDEAKELRVRAMSLLENATRRSSAVAKKI